jgi:predicted O-methyltransferase YrrM
VAQRAAKQIEGAAKDLAKQGLRVAAKAKVNVDRRRATPSSKRLLDVVARALGDDFSAQDRAWFDKVEEQRRVLLASDENLTKVDFGAGAHDDHLTDAEMSAGVVKRTTVGDVCLLTSKQPWWARILYALVAEYQPALALELGTSVGVSAGYQGGALLADGGRLVSIEGAPEIAAVAQRTIDALGLHDVVDIVMGRFGDLLPPFLEKADPLGYVFVDGHHDEHATQEYHRLIKPHLAPGAVLVYDDIHWSPGMERAWAAISSDPELCVTVDLTAIGIAVLGDSDKHAYRYFLRGTN